MDTQTEQKIEDLLERRRRRAPWQQIVIVVFFLILFVLVAALALQTSVSLARLDALRAEVAYSKQEALDTRMAQARAQIVAAERARAMAADFADFQAFAERNLAQSGRSGETSRRARDAALSAFAGARLDLPSRAALRAATAPNATLVSGVDLVFARAAMVLQAMAGEDYVFGGRQTPLEEVITKTRGASYVVKELDALVGDAKSGPTAHLGLARFYYLIASQQPFRKDACALALKHMEAAPAHTDGLARAECLLAVGKPDDARKGFEAVAAPFLETAPEEPAVIETAVRAFDGLAIARISAAKEGAPGFAAELNGAIADLERAIEFRRRLREVRVERTASMEPIGFALLRLGKFEEAVAHTAQVDRSRPMPGNLIVRALAAEQLAGRENKVIAARAREQFGFFRRRQVDECAVRRLMGAYAPKLDAFMASTQEQSDVRPCA